MMTYNRAILGTEISKKILITGCAVAQHCYNGDVSFLRKKWKLWTPVKSKPLNRLTHNLSGLIMSTRGTYVPNLAKIGSRGKGVKYHFLCDFFIYMFFLEPT